MNNGGDVLARGGKTAQFGGANSITDFENDFIYLDVAEICKKYGLSQAEYDQYSALRESNEKLPDLTPVDLQEKLDVGFSITDKRHNYLGEATVPAAAVVKQVKKYPDPVYSPVETLMDRIMVMVISDDPNLELLEDGSAMNKTTGLIETAKYRQHSNVGIVLLAGQWVIMGGLKTPMADILKPGDKVVYGDYNSEVFPMNDDKAIALCDKHEINFEKTAQGVRIVRVQDVRTVQRRQELKTCDYLEKTK